MREMKYQAWRDLIGTAYVQVQFIDEGGQNRGYGMVVGDHDAQDIALKLSAQANMSISSKQIEQALSKLEH